jgi:hypothetical protein
MDFLMGWTAPASATMQWGSTFESTIANSIVRRAVGNAVVTPLAVGDTLQTATGVAVNTAFQVSGWVFGGGTGGNVTLTWAQNTSDAGNLTVKKGSNIRYVTLIA